MSDAPPRVDPSALDDLRQRLSRTRRARLPEGVGWERGTDATYLDDLLDSWAAYDWAFHESRIASWPWVRAAGLRAVHQRAGAAGATAVLLLHGWPDSVLRFEKVLPLLDDVDVVAPALPGYPFAEPTAEVGMSTTTMAERIADLTTELGYARFVVSGGDIGSSVAEQLAYRFPDRVSALHVTDIPYQHLFTVDAEDLTEAEQDYLDRGRAWQMREGAYALEQATKPHTLAAGLSDSPAGLAAWVVEKLRSWTDCDGDVESVFSRDQVLTWISAYWFSNAIGTSFSPYIERPESVPRVDVPTVVSIFPHDLVPAPRELAERFFDVRAFDEQPDGGHFAAWERPEKYVAAVRTALSLASE